MLLCKGSAFILVVLVPEVWRLLLSLLGKECL